MTSSATKPRSRFPGPFVLPILLLFVLLSFPALSVRGAASGLLLWFNVVLPTLAPFMICTQMITALGGAQWMMRPFGPLLQKLFGLSSSGAYILLCGLLCGYPLGAKMCADFLERDDISKREAACLLAICNHPSPMFLSGYVRSQLPVPVPPVLLFVGLYLPILPISLAARYFYGKKDRRVADPALAGTLSRYPSDRSPRHPSGTHSPHPDDTPSLEDVMASACETMVIIGGYIMLFSILVVWIQEFPYGSPALRAFLTGAAEITTGVSSLCRFFHDKKALIPVICAVAFGGFSGIFQTRSVIRGSGLSIRQYIGWKLLHACLSCLITAFLLSLPVR